MADLGYNTRLTCRCGRVKWPQDMLSVGTLGVGAAYLCTACVTECMRREQFDLVTLHRRAGASPQWVAEFQTKLRSAPLHQVGLPQEIWGETYAAELDKAAAISPPALE